MEMFKWLKFRQKSLLLILSNKNLERIVLIKVNFPLWLTTLVIKVDALSLQHLIAIIVIP